MARRPKEEPSDLPAGVARYIEFAQLDPKSVGEFADSFAIPHQAVCLGQSTWVAYSSDKWEKKSNNYIHEHDPGVRTYGLRGADESVSVPGFVRDATTLVRLGRSIGFGYRDSNGKEREFQCSGGELYCIPSGRALFIIFNKKRIRAMMWGGSLTVTWRGIVG